ncbi:MAG: extracellular solute-binding protein [Chloroflexota bacterium]
MLKQLKVLMLVLGLCSLLLAACEAPAPAATSSDGSSDDAMAEEEMMDESVCNVDAPAEPVEMDLIGWPFDIMDFYTTEIEKCGEIENITINAQMQDFTATKDAFRLAMSGGGESPYDMMHVANTGITEFGPVGWLLPLNDLVDKYREQYDLDDISESAWAGGTIDGQIYGIPAVGNTLHLAYRADIFEEYGLEAPETYDDVIVICETLADHPDLDVVFTQDMSAGWAWELEFLHFLRAHGGDYLNEDSTPAFNSPEGVAALTQMKSVVDACMGPEGLALGYEAAEVAMNTGAQAMVHIWASNTVSMFDPEQSDYVDEIAFAPAPRAVEGGPRVGSAWNDFYTIPATTPNDPELIFQILMEALDQESMLRAADVGIVTRTSISKGLPNLPAAGETLANGVGIYSTNPANSLAQAALWNHLPFVGTGELTPEEALAEAEAEYIAEATAQGYLE